MYTLYIKRWAMLAYMLSLIHFWIACTLACARVYAKLLSVPDPSNKPDGSLSKRLNIDPKLAAGLLGQMRGNPRIRADLIKAGYADDQIPRWVAASDAAPADTGAAALGAIAATAADGAPLQRPKPAGGPRTDGKGQKKAIRRAEQSTAQQAQQAEQSTPTPAETLQYSTLAEVNQELGPGGQRIEALCSERPPTLVP